MPTTASYPRSPRAACSSPADARLASLTVKTVASGSDGSMRRQISSPWEAPTATSTWPVVEMYRSWSREDRFSTAPRRMSTDSGLASILASSGTRSPGRS
jgi:hypothetical protein